VVTDSLTGLPMADVLVVTALPEEHDAVLGTLDQVVTRCHLGRNVSLGQVGSLRVAVESLHGMGNVGAAVTASALAAAWRTRHLLLVGIVGGFGHAGVRLGDIIVPDQIAGYEPARLEPNGARRRPEVYRPDFTLLTAARSVTNPEWLPAVQAERPELADEPTVHVGTVLSGEKVIADGSARDGLSREWPTAVGVEMESLGSALAAYRGGVRFLMVKGVSDLADAARDEGWRGYAAEAAARFTIAVLRRLPVLAHLRHTAEPDLAVSGAAMLSLCWRLVDDWPKLARYFEIPPHDTARFAKGDEAMRVWEWLAVRQRLRELPAALVFIGRPDLAEDLSESLAAGAATSHTARCRSGWPAQD
jgi:nucleoside phosphorylase